MTAPTTPEQERAAFEAWCAINNPLYYPSDDGAGNRRDWKVWQARAALSTPADHVADVVAVYDKLHAGNPEAITALLEELDAAQAGIDAAVLAERERCAMSAEDAWQIEGEDVALAFANLIRYVE